MIDFGRLYIVAGRVLSLVPVRIGLRTEWYIFIWTASVQKLIWRKLLIMFIKKFE